VNDRLSGTALAPMRYVTYRARDGLEIPAYLTVPVGRDERQLPLVVLPHGGPFVRDEWDYDFLVQYLANRGYAVLQPNFRGSTGFGRAFNESGFGQFGKAMQDDVNDGVAWLTGAGIADPRRVCVVGWSYGGYVAQVASFRDPDIYRCAASIAGISDLRAMMRYDSRFMFGEQYRKWSARITGNEPSWELNEVSALPQVQAVRMPLFLAHGAAYDKVRVGQSARLAAALRKAGKPHEYLRIENGDHSLWDSAQRTQLLGALDRFLAAHNPTDVLRPVAARERDGDGAVEEVAVVVGDGVHGPGLSMSTR
jgi:dipeptidyl aminopeptidase/acylaminoacyl peptidase